jgi:hypothetical protein
MKLGTSKNCVLFSLLVHVTFTFLFKCRWLTTQLSTQWIFSSLLYFVQCFSVRTFHNCCTGPKSYWLFRNVKKTRHVWLVDCLARTSRYNCWFNLRYCSSIFYTHSPYCHCTCTVTSKFYPHGVKFSSFISRFISVLSSVVVHTILKSVSDRVLFDRTCR